MSAMRGHKDVTEYLVNMGADVNMQTSAGSGVLYVYINPFVHGPRNRQKMKLSL